eukprot:SM000007S20978  [mRNA]  locus=s7:1467157:1469697:+ [translate_table: standard]
MGLAAAALAVLLAVLAAAGGASAQNHPILNATTTPLRWCVGQASELAFCSQIVEVLQTLEQYAPYLNEHHDWSCVRGNGDEGCIDMVAAGDADLGMFDAGSLVYAQKYDLVPYIRERFAGEIGGIYYSVAVVHASFCSAATTLADLQGRSSCHTGYRQTTGWDAPISYMTSGGSPIISLVNRTSRQPIDIQSVAGFFDKSCAANEGDAKICSACSDVETCDVDDDYFGPVGAFKCLVEGDNDVAFTEHNVPLNYAAGGNNAITSWSNLQSHDNYRLLCPTRGCAPLTSYRNCSFGAVPGKALLIRSDFNEQDRSQLLTVLDIANVRAQASGLLFSGSGNIFSPGAVGTEPVPTGTTILEYLGPLEALTNKLDALTTPGSFDYSDTPVSTPSSATLRTTTVTLAASMATVALLVGI